MPVVLPKLSDPRLHLAAVITSLQVLGQAAFDFRLSIAQILVSLGTCAVLEIAITARRQRVWMWPASALLTGNGVAFILRVPGTHHGDWWSLRGWWIFVVTAGVSLLSKYVITWRGGHIFNPSNIGLVLCFLVLGRNRAEPLDFWWGPMSVWLALALVIIVSGGFLILRRLKLLVVAVGFWLSFAAGIAVLAASGHAMTARWHLGPLEGRHFWWVLLTSPEVLVFLFYMITDPKTAPSGRRPRLVYAVSIGLLAALLIAPMQTEYASKVALLSSLAIVCVAGAALRALPRPVHLPRIATTAAAAGVAAFLAVVFLANSTMPAVARPLAHGQLPPISILPSPGVQTQLTRPTAKQIAYALLAARPTATGATLQVHLEQGTGQSPPVGVVQLGGHTYRLRQLVTGAWTLDAPSTAPTMRVPTSAALSGLQLKDVAGASGIAFRQGSFRFGVSNEPQAMMGGGVCWLDYNGDGWVDLFAVNSYAGADTARWSARGGLPTSALYENVHGAFRNVTRQAHAGLAVQGNGCAAADLDGNGRPDLVVSTSSGVEVLWNRGGGTFRRQVLRTHGWYAGVAVADVNGDGRPDIFAAGYADPNEPVAGSLGGFPTNVAGVRDLLFLNEGGGRFREAGSQAGLESAAFSHGLGAVFTDVNGDRRPDLYVANDEDPNQLYVNVAWPGGAQADPAGLGFRFEQRAAAARVADPFAGMGIAAQNGMLVVTNSRDEPTAAYRRDGSSFANARPLLDPALGTASAGWGASWVDLANSGRPDLLVAAGAIPVTSLQRDAEPVRVLAPAARGFGDSTGILGAHGLSLNGRGLAAADVDNDGTIDVAINTIGGKLALLRPYGALGHWLDVDLARFAPGASVTVVLPDGTRLTREAQAGSSYLSSEDPRLHFGLGRATRVARVIIRWPFGGTTRLESLRGDRIVHVAAPPLRRLAVGSSPAAGLAGCTAAGGSVARTWDAAAVAMLRNAGLPAQVQARDLYDLARTMGQAYAQSPTTAAVSFAAYRLLLWQASYGANVATSFTQLVHRLRSLCLSPRFVATTGSSPAAVGNRVALATIAAGRRDGSNEALHFADPAYTPENQPLVVAQSVSTPHDATFWQPLALAQVAPRGSAPVPAEVQVFGGSQWGRVRTFSPQVKRLTVGAPPLGIPTSRAYRDAALAAVRATAGTVKPPSVDASPAAWNTLALTLPRASVAQDLRLELALNGALNDAAVAAYGAKRKYQSPRPISMIRYLAFNGELPLVPGLSRKRGAVEEVRLGGRWVEGSRWTPPAATPPSPGWVSADAAYAYAADRVLTALTGRSFAARAARIARAGVADGTELAADAAAGRTLGRAIGRLALARVGAP
jgi:Na+-translocating ferredoxin:NAD+ oxidoreductase RnfD subunit